MKSRVSVGIVMIASAVLLMLAREARADSANLSVASPGTVSQGSTFTVDVNISGVTDLYDYQLDLAFNPSVVSAMAVLEGSFLSSGGPTVFLPGTIDNAAGTITLNADTLVGAIPGVTGSGTLLEFEFSALAAGTSELVIANEILQDSTGAVLSDTVTNGLVMVPGTGTVPEPSSFVLIALGVMGLAGVCRKRITP